jgi:type I restriction enzyme S subunit
LDKADELRAKRRAASEELNALKKAVFFQMFGDPATNPHAYPECRLGDLVRIATGTTPSRAEANNYGGDVPWVKTTEVNGWEILETEERITRLAAQSARCHIYPKGSIVVALYGQGKTRGHCAILGIDAATNQACGVLLPGEKHEPVFLKVLLDLSYERLRSLSRGGNQENLNLSILADFRVFVPSLEMQRAFVERVLAVRRLEIGYQSGQQDVDALFTSLQHRAFSGVL